MKLALALLIALATPAFAHHERPWPDASAILVPPPQYDPRVKPYTGRLTVKVVPHADVYRACGNGRSIRIGTRVLACAMPRGRTCTVILAAGMPEDLERAVRRHEVGHCKGFTHK